MALAALEAGIAFSNASVTIIHGMSRPIGALFHIAHGQSNAMLLNVCLKFLKVGAIEQLNQLAKTIGAYKQEMTAEEGADAFVVATIELLGILNVKSIQEFNVSEEEYFTLIPKMTKDAIASSSPANTRRSLIENDVIKLYEELWAEGHLKLNKAEGNVDKINRIFNISVENLSTKAIIDAN